MSIDCNSRYVYLDPWRGGAIAVAESARNIACSGGTPLGITNCLNFGNPEKPEIYWQFVHATDGIAEACRVLSTPVSGGNVSLYNEFDGEAIYPTPTIGMVGLLESVEQRVTSDFKASGDIVLLLGESKEEIGASEAFYILTAEDAGEVPYIDLAAEKALQQCLITGAKQGLIQSAHDCSEGGLSVALVESAIQGNLGVEIAIEGTISEAAILFGETQSRVVVTVTPEKLEKVITLAKELQVPVMQIGTVAGSDFNVTYNNKKLIQSSVAELSKPWKESLACTMK